MQEISEECHSTLWYPLEKRENHTQPYHSLFHALFITSANSERSHRGLISLISLGDHYYKCCLPLASAAGMYYFLLVPR